MNKRMMEIEELRANGDLPRNVYEELCDEYDELSQTFNRLRKLGDQVGLKFVDVTDAGQYLFQRQTRPGVYEFDQFFFDNEDLTPENMRLMVDNGWSRVER